MNKELTTRQRIILTDRFDQWLNRQPCIYATYKLEQLIYNSGDYELYDTIRQDAYEKGIIQDPDDPCDILQTLLFDSEYHAKHFTDVTGSPNYYDDNTDLYVIPRHSTDYWSNSEDVLLKYAEYFELPPFKKRKAKNL